jgi:central glycolytic genes regulator
MTTLADMMVPLDKTYQHLFVPARGGLGEKVENQANTIVAEMARKAKGDYRLLYVPDPLSETSYQTMINEPSIISALELIKKSDIVIHSIGDALTMAERRKTSDETIRKLKDNHAVSEAFGYYFDRSGRVVHTVRTIGIQIEDLSTTNCVITIAGGETKADAIVSYFQHGKSDLLITDEAAALQILRDNSL